MVDPKFSTQTKARKAALDILFQADLRGLEAGRALEEQQGQAEQPFRPFTVDLVRGVAEHGRAIDRRIDEACSKGWSVARMPRVDRNLARIAIFELDHTDTPDSVVIAEALELASWLSTDESPAFLNGLLSRAVEQRTE